MDTTPKALLLLICCAFFAPVVSDAADAESASLQRQSLDDAWWTGPILAASASTLPQGHALIEPYLYDVISNGRYDSEGERRDTSDAHTLGSLTYMLYGLTDKVSAGLIPRFAFNDVNGGSDSSGVLIGDLTLQAQYRLTQFQEGRAVPTTSFVIQATLPTGEHDRLDRPSDGAGSGAWSMTLGWYAQHYFWLPNGRILRGRVNVSQTFSDTAEVNDVSVYGTEAGFTGRASPGDSFSIIVAGEYSITRSWVLAMDLLYQHDAATHLSGEIEQVQGGAAQFTPIEAVFPSSQRYSVSPAIEYSWNARMGVIVGAIWTFAGRNTSASITPVIAVNMVF